MPKHTKYSNIFVSLVFAKITRITRVIQLLDKISSAIDQHENTVHVGQSFWIFLKPFDTIDHGILFSWNTIW